MKGQRFASAGLWDSAASCYSAVIEIVEQRDLASRLLPVPIQAARCDLGTALVFNREYQAGIEQLRRALSACPAEPHLLAELKANLMLCWAHASIGEFDAAELAYQTANRIAESRRIDAGDIIPGYILSPRIYLARLRYFEGELGEAADLASALLQESAAGLSCDPVSLLIASRILGVAKRECGELNEAERHLTAARRIDKGSPALGAEYEAAIEIARLRLIQGRIPEAERLLIEVGCEIGKLRHFHALLVRSNGFLGLVRSAQGRISEAQTLIESALQSSSLDPPDAQVLRLTLRKLSRP